MARDLSPPTEAPLDGTKYRLIELLGRGGMGQVWRAEHVALGAEVVVKILHPEYSKRADLSDRLRLEGQALGQLRHPNIVSVVDAGTTASGQAFLVMERLRGRTLSVELNARRFFTVGESLALTTQVLAALTVAHDAGVVHRDIKPSNLFLCKATTEDGAPFLKLIDFGIAKVVGEGVQKASIRPLDVPTEAGEVLGTPTALSPEQALGRPVDRRADVYAVGLVLYRLLTGQHPFAGFHGADLLRAYAAREPEPPSKIGTQPISPELDAVVMQALRTKPEERFSSATDFLRAVRRCQSQEEHGAVIVRSPSVPSSTADTAAVAPISFTSGVSPAYGTERIGSSELSALDAVLGSTEYMAPSIRTDAQPVTRTASGPLVAMSSTPPAGMGRFIAIASATALVVLGVLVFLFWR